MRTVEKAIGNLLEGLLAICFFTILVLVVLQVFLRYVLNTSIVGANEVIVILFVYTSAIGGAIAAGRGEHISLTFATEMLSKKAQQVLARVCLVLVAFINAVMVWFSFHWIGITGGYLMPSTGLSRAVTQVSIPIGCGLAVIYCLVKAFSPAEEKGSTKP
jgi:TRAP-type C4-dicarboxylate transport system permease small subunit